MEVVDALPPLPVEIIGMNSHMMCNKIKFSTDHLLVVLGCHRHFTVGNPFEWMEIISLQSPGEDKLLWKICWRVLKIRAPYVDRLGSNFQAALTLVRWGQLGGCRPDLGHRAENLDCHILGHMAEISVCLMVPYARVPCFFSLNGQISTIALYLWVSRAISCPNKRIKGAPKIAQKTRLRVVKGT